MVAEWIEARLYWGDDLLALTHTVPRKDLRFEDLGLPALPAAGDLHVQLTLVPRDQPPLPRASRDLRVAFALLGAFVLHFMFGAVAFHGRVAPGDEEASARAAMMTYAAAIDARTHAKIDPHPAPAPDKGGEATEGKSGLAGNPTRENDVGRTTDTLGTNHRVARPEEIRAEVSTFGMLALVASDHPGDEAGSSPWAKDLGPSAMGNMFGVTIDDAAGFGGLGLTGGGEGGGGKGHGVGFDLVVEKGGFGTCGSGCVGRVTGGHVVRTITMRCPDCTVQVNGRLPPEAVQRVVRASFGRFRACYEQGLMRDPGLEGRVATKFVIARDGSVAMVSAAESSLPDASVAKCVERAFYNLTFPQPEGGIVTVVYPFAFSTSP